MSLLHTSSRILAIVLGLTSASAATAATVGYWRFEEGAADAPASGAGAVLDSSSLLSHGTPSGGPVYRSDVPLAAIPLTGAANHRSLEFDGSDDLVSIASVFPFHTAGDATLEFWIKCTPDAHRSPIWTRNDGSDLDRFNFFVNANSTFGFDYREPAGSIHLLVGGGGNGVPIPSGSWTHVAIVRTGSSYALYLGGSLSASVTDSSPQLPSAIGWVLSGRPGFRFRGLLDEVRLSNTALTPAEFLSSPIAVPATSTGWLLVLVAASLALALRALGPSRARPAA